MRRRCPPSQTVCRTQFPFASLSAKSISYRIVSYFSRRRSSPYRHPYLFPNVVRLGVALPRVLEVVRAQNLVFLDQGVVFVDDDGEEERESNRIYADEKERKWLEKNLNGSLNVALAEAALTVNTRELCVVIPVGWGGGVAVEDVQCTPCNG